MKKVFISLLLVVGIVSFAACGKSNYNIADYLIEERENLFSGQDNVYSATFSSGMREENYSLDGIVNNMVEFGIITLARNDNHALINDTYTYVLTIDGESFTGFLEKSEYDNTYSIDVGKKANNDSVINLRVTFTGYSFNEDLSNLSSAFTVDKNAALKIANTELKDSIKDIMSTKNTKIETIMKMLKDHSDSEVERYYWYIGVVSTNGETLGILIDSSNGEVVAKKL